MAKEKKISKEKIEEGIRISLRKSLEHLDGAEALISKNLLNDAVALIEFAIEEFGRAVYLRERQQRGIETIENSLEINHYLKYDKAFSVLSTNLKTIWESTITPIFPIDSFPDGYPIKETISPLTRLNATFTYFDERTQHWRNGIKADITKLKSVVDELRKNIETFKF